ncbi:MAG: hypothetical protein QM758_10225 [Armatimonas sp.]
MARLSPEMLVALVSLTVSVGALVTTVLQTNIMRAQQAASVWPHLELSSVASNRGLSLHVVNKGIGPALVKKVTIRYQGQTFHDPRLALYAIYGKPSLPGQHVTTSMEGGVLTPGEDVTMFSSDNPDVVKKVAEARPDIHMDVEYESVYGDRHVATFRGAEAMASEKATIANP